MPPSNAETQSRPGQSSGVIENETPRAPPESITTSDGPAPIVERRPRADAAAADSDNDQDGADTSDPASDDEDRNKRPRHRKRSSERQIARLRAELADRELRDAEREQRIAALEAQARALPPAPKAKEPVITDFNSPREYAKAYSKWEADKTAAEVTPSPTRRAPAAPAEPVPPIVTDPEVVAFNARVRKAVGAERFEDIQKSRELRIDQDMAEFLMDADHGPTMYAWLADNVEESLKISRYGPLRKAKALTALEAKAKAGELDDDDDDDDDALDLRSERRYDEPEDDEPKGKAADRTVTRAPKPPSDTRPRSNAPTAPDLNRLEMPNYARQRAREEAEARGHYR